MDPGVDQVGDGRDVGVAGEQTMVETSGLLAGGWETITQSDTVVVKTRCPPEWLGRRALRAHGP